MTETGKQLRVDRRPIINRRIGVGNSRYVVIFDSLRTGHVVLCAHAQY